MYITNSELAASESTLSQSEAPTAFSGTNDVNFFNAHLNPSRQPDIGGHSTMLGKLFNVGGPESATAHKRVKRGVRDVMMNKQTKEAYALPESLAAANLSVVTPVKVLSLAIKGLDKIATMG